ncbi:MAG: type II and III secretion system protein [Elusimicrobiota bacterium]|jgi:pilus assembly protein CpaC|nr:type II and III secretion system protein [Elusimicrobiota bacterium]
MKRFIIVPLLFLSTLLYAQQLIEISVEITEVNENKSIELGIQWPTESGISYSGDLNSIPSVIGTGDWIKNTKFTSSLKALEDHGLATILAKPKIITKSGTEASFMVGGEIPIVTSNMTGTTVDWKEFGIILKITPSVVKDDNIGIVVNTELSRIDNSIQAGGYPGIATRKANSNLEIKSGETMVLAGLIQTTKEQQRSGVPFLCDIPIIGRLFSVTKDIFIETNVLIFITPRLITQDK